MAAASRRVARTLSSVGAVLIPLAAACSSSSDSSNAPGSSDGGPFDPFNPSADGGPAGPFDASCVYGKLLEGRAVGEIEWHAGVGVTGPTGPTGPTEPDECGIYPSPYGTGVSSGVSVFFALDDCQGRPITDRTDLELEVVEDGAPVSTVEAAPVFLERKGQVAFVNLLIDLSSSIAPKLADVQSAAKSFVDTLAAETQVPTHVGLSAFAGDERVTVFQPPTLDYAAVRSAIDKLTTFAPSDPTSTNLYGAVSQGICQVDVAQSTFRRENRGGVSTNGYVVLFTDGKDTAGRAMLSETAKAVAKRGDMLLAVALPSPDFDDTARSALCSLTLGGATCDAGTKSPFVFEVQGSGSSAELQSTFNAMATRIREQYKRTHLLGYCSAKRTGTHTVAIRAKSWKGKPVENRTTAEYAFKADGLTGGCNAAKFESLCAADQSCGGLGCGSCTAPGTACKVCGTSYPSNPRGSCGEPTPGVCAPVAQVTCSDVQCTSDANGCSCSTGSGATTNSLTCALQDGKLMCSCTVGTLPDNWVMPPPIEVPTACEADARGAKLLLAQRCGCSGLY